MKFIYCLLVSTLLCFACKKESSETKTFFVANHRVDCTGSGPQQCLLVKEREQDDWQFFYDGIEGFTYEPGFQYKLEVRVYDVANPPADASGKRYVLKRIINKQ